MLETSGSFSAITWVESFIRQTSGFHLPSVMQCSTERDMLSCGGKKIKWDSFWKEWDNSKSLLNCILVHVLIISATKWETLKTGESATNLILLFDLQKLDTLTLPAESFSLWIWVLFFFFPVVKMNMVVSSQLSSITELNLTLLTAQTTGCRQVICLCCAAVVVMWLSLLAKAGPLFSAQGWGHWSSNVL